MTEPEERGGGAASPLRILADQLTLSQPGRADYTHHINACPPGFENLAASLKLQLRPNPTELRSMDSCNQIFSSFQKYKRKVPPPALPPSKKNKLV